MAIALLCVGRLKAGPERELFDRYWGRSKPSSQKLGFGRLDVRELRESSHRNAEVRKEEEGRQLEASLDTNTALLVFDERGSQHTTPEFCKLLERHRDDGKDIALVIGGPDGLSAKLREQAHTSIGFGRMTLPHQLVRVLVAEQLYRAFSIMEGHPYHRP